MKSIGNDDDDDDDDDVKDTNLARFFFLFV